MRVSFLILFIVLTSFLAADIYSQTVTVSINMQNVTVEDVLNEIEKKSDYYFLFNQKLVDVNRKVNAVFEDVSLKEILKEIFKGSGIDFIVFEHQIILTTNELAKNMAELSSFIVKGVITDSYSGEVLPGAVMQIEGSQISTLSDYNGNYSISPKSGDVVLYVSCVGYNTEKVFVQGRGYIDIKLKPDVKVLDEVIVVGYGTTLKQNLTTSVSKVNTKIIPSSASSSVSELLFGRASGLNAMQLSSEPGGDISLSIRGRNSPLLIVDGVRYPNSGLEPDNGDIELQGVNRGGIAGLNPSDIESVEVLKDASAAIYGVAAADGVILITTKKGKIGQMNINYEASRSVVKNMTYMEPLSGKDYMIYYNQFNKDKYLSDNYMVPFGNVTPSGFVPKYSDADIANATNQTDWLEEIFRTGSIDNHTLTINGGSEKVTYYFSGNYFNQKGTLERSGMRRYLGRLSISYKLTNFLSLNTTVNTNRSNFNNAGSGWQTGNAGTEAFGALQAAMAYPAYLSVYDSNNKYTLFDVIGNPVSLLDIKDNTETNGLLGNISVDMNIIKDILSVKLLYGNNYDYSIRDFFIPSTTYWKQKYLSRASLFEQRRQYQTMEGIISFKKKFKDIISVDAVTGLGQYIEDGAGYGMEASEILDNINTTAMQSATGTKILSSFKYAGEMRSFFVRSNFTVFDSYLLSLSYRLDGSDKFFPKNKYASFPSASVGWKIFQEPFMSRIKFVDLFKLRASIGLTGKTLGTDAYSRLDPDPNIVYFNNGTSSYTPYYQTSEDNLTLGWQKTINKNIGLDITLFSNRISATIELFSDKTLNLLSARPSNQLYYIPSVFDNDGVSIRKGYEFSIHTINLKTINFEWETNINLSHYAYNWEKRYLNSDIYPYAKENDPVNAIYVFETDGIWQLGEEIPSYQPYGARLPGSPKFVDKDVNGILDYRDVVTFNSDPKLSLGFGNTIKYKRFDLSIFFYGQFGAYGWNNSLIWSDPNNILSGKQSGSVEVKNVWSTSNPGGIWPGVTYNESVLGLPASVDTRLAKKDFLRCRNITLGYTIKPNVSIKYFKNIRVYLDIQNLFIITNFKGTDPEVQTGATKGGPAPYPMTRVFSVGLNANF